MAEQTNLDNEKHFVELKVMIEKLTNLANENALAGSNLQNDVNGIRKSWMILEKECQSNANTLAIEHEERMDAQQELEKRIVDFESNMERRMAIMEQGIKENQQTKISHQGPQNIQKQPHQIQNIASPQLPQQQLPTQFVNPHFQNQIQTVQNVQQQQPQPRQQHQFGSLPRHNSSPNRYSPYQKQKICNFHIGGHCGYGDSCKFLHDDALKVQFLQRELKEKKSRNRFFKRNKSNKSHRVNHFLRQYR